MVSQPGHGAWMASAGRNYRPPCPPGGSFWAEGRRGASGSRHPSLTCSCWDYILAPHQPRLAPVQENLREELAEGQDFRKGGPRPLGGRGSWGRAGGAGQSPTAPSAGVTKRVASRQNSGPQPLISRVLSSSGANKQWAEGAPQSCGTGVRILPGSPDFEGRLPLQLLTSGEKVRERSKQGPAGDRRTACGRTDMEDKRGEVEPRAGSAV